MQPSFTRRLAWSAGTVKLIKYRSLQLSGTSMQPRFTRKLAWSVGTVKLSKYIALQLSGTYSAEMLGEILRQIHAAQG